MSSEQPRMTVSERLGEWDEYLPLYANQNEPRLWKLRQALPELIALVQAAELVEQGDARDGDFGVYPVLPSLYEALTALECKLGSE